MGGHRSLRPAAGVVLESAALAVVLYVASLRPVAGILGAVTLLVLQAAAAFLVHCPAHYLVGSLVGVRFRRISLARSTMADALPPPLRSAGALLPVLRLSVRDAKLSSPGGLRAMYLSGVAASVGLAFLVAAAVSLTGDVLASALTWAYALAYLASDVLLSPKAGDVMKARRVGRQTTPGQT